MISHDFSWITFSGKFDMFDLFTDGATTSPKTRKPPTPNPQPSLRGLRPWYRKHTQIFCGYQHGFSSACRSSMFGCSFYSCQGNFWPLETMWPVWSWFFFTCLFGDGSTTPFSWYQPCVQEKDRTQLMLRTTMCASSKRNVNIPPPHPAPKTVYSTDISNRRYGKLPRIGTRRVLCTNCRFPSCNTYFRNQLSTSINCDTDTVISET